ncbi:2-oxo acid dehydrogenase subunit E2 [Propionibacterium australiense]|nr:dihydrolipoamide acetyltransferase family protein [Propionibacterium australiense]RLP07673.1 2-oxo acid dehydrogenase subunit E2 [Propionibacterium australiense]RLP08100.1 2-oxo acid dehydrogenase subunit E2 [Propionibacterium australiense]
MPDAGEGLTEAVIVEWHVAVGDRVRVNDDLLSVETAKSVVELPSPFAGTVTQILAAEGETVEVGAPVVVIDDGPEPAGEAPGDEPAGADQGAAVAARASAPEAQPPAPRQDEEAAGFSRPESTASAGAAPEAGRPVLVGYGATPGSVPPRARRRRVHEVSRRTGARPRHDDQHDADAVRRATARNVTASKDSKVHTTAFVECDAGSVVDLVTALRARRDFAGLHVTPLLIWCKAVCLAMRTNPMINASWPSEQDRITLHESVNIGFAADTPHGLLVPVIRDAQDRDLKDMAAELGRLVKLAKAGQLQPADYSGGTFSITNLGGLGLDAGTPIISGNESAILAIGSIRRRPWVSERDGEEFIEPRWTAMMSLSFDHRLIDGVEAARFLSDLAALITNPALAMMY